MSVTAINGKTDDMLDLKENVITGHAIPAGTGMRDFDNLIAIMQRAFFDSITYYLT